MEKVLANVLTRKRAVPLLDVLTVPPTAARVATPFVVSLMLDAVVCTCTALLLGQDVPIAQRKDDSLCCPIQRAELPKLRTQATLEVF